jgi:hypothetical protein
VLGRYVRNFRSISGRRIGLVLTEEVKLTDFGGASTVLSKEDERSARLAERAQKGDYDDGMSELRPGRNFC